MSNIFKQIGTGVFYTALAKYSNVFIIILIGVVLARLLSPEEFGIITMITVFITFFNLFSDFGIGPAIIQSQSLNDEDLQSIFSVSILFGFILALIFYFIAPTIAGFYNEPNLIEICEILALSVLFYSLQVVPKSLAIKKLWFKKIGIISVGIQLVSGIIAIILAFKGFSYFALVIRSVINSFVTFIAFYYLFPLKPKFFIQIKSIKKIAKFSSFQFLFNFVNYFSRNSDKFLIGKYFDLASLGYYDKAYALMMLPIQNLSHVITPVLLPVLSPYIDKKKIIYNTYYNTVKLLATIGFPLSVFLYFSAGDIIYILYGVQWLASIPVFKLLAITVGIQTVLSSTGSLFQIVNRTDLLFISGMLSAFFMVAAILLGIFYGTSLISVVFLLIFAFIINFFQTFYILLRFALGLSFIKFLNVFLFPLLISLVLVFNLYFFSELNILNNYLSLFLKILVAIITFSLVFWTSSENRLLIKNYFKNNNNRSI